MRTHLCDLLKFSSQNLWCCCNCHVFSELHIFSTPSKWCLIYLLFACTILLACFERKGHTPQAKYIFCWLIQKRPHHIGKWWCFQLLLVKGKWMRRWFSKLSQCRIKNALVDIFAGPPILQSGERCRKQQESDAIVSVLLVEWRCRCFGGAFNLMNSMSCVRVLGYKMVTKIVPYHEYLHCKSSWND